MAALSEKSLPARGDGAQTRGGRLLHTPVVLWSVFILAHVAIGFVAVNAKGDPLGDVSILYSGWISKVHNLHYFVGIDGPWVYPILALVPMLAAVAFGFHAYTFTWLTMVTILDIVAFAFLVGRGRDRRANRIGWWWIAFLVLLGPIALGRIDSVTIPIAIVAVLIMVAHPRIATILLTIGAWMKVWPVAIIAALVVATKHRLSVIVAALTTTAVIIGTAVALGSGKNVFSFITMQTARNLQMEAPISTIWMWMAEFHVPGSYVQFDRVLLTSAVHGPGEPVAVELMNPVLVVAVLAIAAIGYLAVRRGAPVTEIFPSLALAFTTALIAFNKVGSPQYMSWLSVPIILGLAVFATGRGRSFRTPAIISLAIASLTQAIYPYLYKYLNQLSTPMLVILTTRNALLFVLLGWAILQLWRLSRPGVVHEALPDGESWLPAPWAKSPAFRP